MIYILSFNLKDYHISDYDDIQIDFQKLKEGDAHEKEKLVHKYLTLIKKKCKGHYGLDEDLLQEILLVIYDRVIDHFDSKRDFYVYLSQVLNFEKYKYYNQNNDEENWISLETEDENEFKIKDKLSADVNIEDQVIFGDEKVKIHKAIDTLDYRKQEIIKKYYGFGCPPRSLRKIAKDVGLSHQGVKIKLDEAKDYLRKRFNWEKCI